MMLRGLSAMQRSFDESIEDASKRSMSPELWEEMFEAIYCAETMTSLNLDCVKGVTLFNYNQWKAKKYNV